MDLNEQLTDRQRVQLTQLSYTEMPVGTATQVGVVIRDVHAPDGMRCFVIAHNQEMTLLFKGSYGLKKGSPETWRNEWLKTNLPILEAMLTNQRRIPSQLKTAAILLQDLLRKYRGYNFYLYGHSLGAINAQYALVKVKRLTQLRHAYLYEGPNIWNLLTPEEQRRARKLWQRVDIYEDIYDPVTLGITDSHRMIGRLQYVDSPELASKIDQHMWGGYRFDQQGRLKTKEIDERFLQESQRQRKFLATANELSQLPATFPEKIPHNWEQLINRDLIIQIKRKVLSNHDFGSRQNFTSTSNSEERSRNHRL
ncbi:hypothetical protein [Lactobacillus corticis]|uniref:DUF2974 domain-containing protein n=1 Tax=Lactobacillus corticis TaxID=2201249 RepID=A0A916VHG3_9LACO|nr:hypothetical protein [Lactobacillus corticis]GFZ26278.1 hypothetical protein LCB40_01580 [Lactobacillus corticis]